MIGTARLTLRSWRGEEIAPLGAMARDAEVMHHLGGIPADAGASTRVAIDAHRADQAAHGPCFEAIECRDNGTFLGVCRLRRGGPAGTPLVDALEIGWWLRRGALGERLRARGRRCLLRGAWAQPDASRVTAWIVPSNPTSWGLMIWLGMDRGPGLDFDHPFLAAGHPLSRHIIYARERPAGE